MASDSRRNCVGTFVPPPALLCQTSFLLPVRGFAMVGHSAGPNSWPPLATSPAPCSCILLFFLLTGLRYRRVRWDKSHRLFMRGPAHVPLCRLSGRDVLGPTGVTKPGPPVWPGAAATLPVTQGHNARLPCQPGAPPAPRCHRLLCGGPAPPPLNPGGAGGSSPLGTGTRAPTD